MEVAIPEPKRPRVGILLQRRSAPAATLCTVTKSLSMRLMRVSVAVGSPPNWVYFFERYRETLKETSAILIDPF